MPIFIMTWRTFLRVFPNRWVAVPDRTDSVAIIGGGCAGLSLGAALAGKGWSGEVTVIERREDYVHDRSWGYWAVKPNSWNSLARHSWKKWTIRSNGTELLCGSERYSYDLIQSSDFYPAALDCLHQASNVHLRLGAGVRSLEPTQQGGVQLELENGERLGARLAFSSMAGRLHDRRHPMLQQHFLAQQVQLDGAIFDPDRVTLMDFDVDQQDGIHFVYLLPMAEDLALVYDTWITPFQPHFPRPWPEERYRKGLKNWLRSRHGVERYEVLSEEIGVIPMTTLPLPRRQSAGVVPIGTAAGAVRASSGYAFSAIQRHSEQIAQVLSTGRQPEPRSPRAAYLELLDRILLWHLVDHPEDFPAIMMALFRDCEPDALVRFLADCPTVNDVFRVMKAVPSLPMIQSLVRRFPRLA